MRMNKAKEIIIKLGHVLKRAMIKLEREIIKIIIVSIIGYLMLMICTGRKIIY